MKKLLLISIPILLILSSCEVVVVEEPIPQNNRALFLGTFDVEEYSSTYDDFTYYYMRVVRGEYSNEVFLTNFYGADIDVLAEIDGNYLYIPDQRINGYRIEGNGRVNGDKLTINFSVEDYYNHNTPINYCEIIGWR